MAITRSGCGLVMRQLAGLRHSGNAFSATIDEVKNRLALMVGLFSILLLKLLIKLQNTLGLKIFSESPHDLI